MPQSSTLISYRQQHNLTQKELAFEIGINPAVLLRIEKNIGSYNVRKVLQWCQHKGVSPMDVFPPDAAA